MVLLFMIPLVIPSMDAIGAVKWKWNLYDYNRTPYD
jgi:hypothetical protein